MFREFCCLLTFVSRLRPNMAYDFNTLAISRSFRLLPLWGLILGAGAAGFGYIFNYISPQISGVIALGWVFLLTGGEPWFCLISLLQKSSGAREDPFKENLEKENKPIRGLIGGFLLLLIKFTFYSQAFNDYKAFPLLPAGMIFSSWVVIWSIFTFPAKAEGKGAFLHGNFSRGDFLTASMLASLILLLFRDWQIISAALIGLLGIIYLCRKWIKSSGGLNWFNYSSLMVWGELFFLFGYYLIGAFTSQIALRVFL